MDTPVPMSLLRELLDIASHAPSAGNARPWQFLVVDDGDLLAAMAEINRQGSMARHAPVGVLVCSHVDRGNLQGFWTQDCAAVTQNLLLAAHDRGLGAVWTGLFPVRGRVEATRELFHLGDSVMPFALVLLGYPARRSSDPPPRGEFTIRYNRWNDVRSFDDAARASADTSRTVERLTRS
jgi:nitroreductase